MKTSNVDVGTINVKGFRCERCGHTWIPRKGRSGPNGPVECPNCKSPWWREKRTKERTKKGQQK